MASGDLPMSGNQQGANAAQPSSSNNSKSNLSTARSASTAQGGAKAGDSEAAPPSAPFASTDRSNRPLICGSDAPERPYPIYLRGVVERGFGRGGKDLGCPTANLPSKVLANASANFGLSRTGVYYGWARVLPQDPDDPDFSSDAEPDGYFAGGAVAASHGGNNGEDDDDDDDNEVVLGASPVNIEGNWDAVSKQSSSGIASPANASSTSLTSRNLKPRQGSKSSVHSTRSANALTDALNSSSLGGRLSSDSQQQRTSSENGRPSSSQKPGSELSLGSLPSPFAPGEGSPRLDTHPGSSEEKKSEGTGLPGDSKAGTQQAALGKAPESATTPLARPSAPNAKAGGNVVAGEKHPRDVSTPSSSSFITTPGGSRISSRGKKKMRINLAQEDSLVFPMVMSVGYNPFYGNTVKTAEVHIMHKFKADFYGLEVRVVVLGFERPELNYVSREALIEDIETDKKVALNSLARPLYLDYRQDPFLLSSFSES